LGHDAHTVADEQLSGASDQTLLQACRTEGKNLITLDLDFSDIRAYAPGTDPGIWVLRPPKQTFKAWASLLAGAMAASRQWDSFRAGLPRRVCWLKRGVANVDRTHLNRCRR